ncbi:MAG: hypothetical protein QGI33_05965 [Candidatus Brocadiia bacterium]|nr:hypothetical protein [Candidatus Brocadiia bacterium]
MSRSTTARAHVSFMPAPGRARAARFADFPFLEIRGISAMADSEAESVWLQNLPRTMTNVGVVLETLVRAID